MKPDILLLFNAMLAAASPLTDLQLGRFQPSLYIERTPRICNDTTSSDISHCYTSLRANPKLQPDPTSTTISTTSIRNVPTTTTKTRITSTARTITTLTTSKSSTPRSSTSTSSKSTITSSPALGCFPYHQRSIPKWTDSSSASDLDKWWCDQSSEYAFMGFSYDVGNCQTQNQLNVDFKNMKNKYGARYVRVYGACDQSGFWDRVVAAAEAANMGVYSLIWFGFDGGDEWKTRKSHLIQTVLNNPKAPFIIRNIAVGSEPLYDDVLSPSDLRNQIVSVQNSLKKYKMQVTISELAYGYQSNNDAPGIFDAIDIVEANILPFFSDTATSGSGAWGNLAWSVSYFQEQAPEKVLRITQTGWPSNEEVWKATAKSAVATVNSERQYYDLLDQHCTDFKNLKVGWFAHIYQDDTLPGWGIVTGDDNTPKFPFEPRIRC